MIFLITDRLRMRNSLIVRHLILGVEYSEKSVSINNHINEMFTVLLTTDLWLSSINNYKNSNSDYKKREGIDKNSKYFL